MVIFKLRSTLTATGAMILVLMVIGTVLFRVDITWEVAVEVVLTGGWGSRPGQFGRGTGVDDRPRGPQALAADAAGHVVVADSINGRVQVFNPDGELRALFAVPAGGGDSAGQVNSFGLLQHGLAWGTGFRPTPHLAGPVSVTGLPVVREGAVGAGGDLPVSGRLSPVYITDVGLSDAAWRSGDASAGVDSMSGPMIYLMAGWDGIILAVDVTGAVEWSRDLAGEYPGARPEAGYLLDLAALPDGSVLVTGYILLADSLAHFVRLVPGPDQVATDLAYHTLTRGGAVQVDHSLPIQLEVESVGVGADGRLYVVAVISSEAGPAHSDRPFRRDVWIFSRQGGQKGKVTLECETYTKYLRLVGVDDRGLFYARVGDGDSGSLAVFDSTGGLVMSLPLGDRSETADVFLGRDGYLYASEATDEGYRVLRYAMTGQRRVVWRRGGD